MPLPDERPRQSVANLIGRFETQSKRHPSTATPPRSSSVVSHTTGDSAKEELKEKREWPPKSAVEAPNVPSPPSSFRFKSPLPQPEPFSTAPDPPDPPATTNGTSNAKPEVNEALPETVSAQPEIQEEVPPPPPKPAPSKTRTPASPAKPTTPRTAASAPKTTIRPASTPKTPAGLTQPLRPQHTGQSATSTSAKKTSTKPTPSTPARPKTPARTTAIPTRAPSSGLYAPTAASLARSRNAPASTQTPVKKATLSSSAADRLSKPTAASLSRARSPVTTPSKTTTPLKAAATPAKSTIRGSGAGRDTLGRGGKTPATPSRAGKSGDKSGDPAKPTTDLVVQEAAVANPIAVAALDAEATAESSQPEDKTLSTPEDEVGAEAAVEEHHMQSSPEPKIKLIVSDEEDTVPPVHEALSASPQSEAEPEYEAGLEGDLDGSSSVSEEPASETVEGNTNVVADELVALASKHDGTDLEQIVTFLETVPVTGTISENAGTPSELQEIPDEEQ